MRRNFLFEDRTFFTVDLDEVVDAKPVTFPLYIHMPLNGSMILRFSPKDAPKSAELERYKAKKLATFACPEEFLDQWLSYRAEIVALDGLKTYRAGNLETDQKKALLIGIGKDMVKMLGDLASDDPRAKQAALKQVNKMTSDIVRTGMQTHKMKSIYDDLALLAEAQIEHSTAVSTMSVIFALTAGYVDEADLADLSMSAFLHDIGMALAPPSLFSTPFEKYTAADLEIYRRHPAEGLAMLEDVGDDVTPLAKLVVGQHHEQYDGGGFPNAMAGLDIDERVQIVTLADLVSDLMDGQVTGERKNPLDALEWIKVKQYSGQKEKIVGTELFESIYRIVRRTKS